MKLYAILIICLIINSVSAQVNYQVKLNKVVEDFEGTTHMLSEKHFYNPVKSPIIPSIVYKYKLFSFDLNAIPSATKNLKRVDSSESNLQHNNIIFLSGRSKDNLTKIIIPDRNFNLDFTDDTILTFDLTIKKQFNGEFDNFEGKNLLLNYFYGNGNNVIDKSVDVKIFHHDSTIGQIYGNPRDKDYIMFVRQHERKYGTSIIKGECFNFFVQPYVWIDEFQENFYLSCKTCLDTSITKIKYYTKDSLFPIANKLYKISLSKNQDSLFLKETDQKVKKYELNPELSNRIFNMEKTVLGSGEVIKLSKFKGKYMLIQFWGTWCKPCLKELPIVAKINKRLDEKKIKFISVACDFDSIKIKNYLINNQYLWDNIFENIDSQNERNWSYLFKISEYPHWILINPQGEVIRKGNIPINELVSILEYETKTPLIDLSIPKSKE